MLYMKNAMEQSVLFWGDTDLNSKLDKTNQDILVFYFDFNYCWSTCIYHADLASFDRDIWRNTEYIKFNVNISVCILRKIGEIILVTSNHSFRFVLIYDGIPHHTLRFPKFGSQKLTQSFNLPVKNLLKFMNSSVWFHLEKNILESVKQLCNWKNEVCSIFDFKQLTVPKNWISSQSNPFWLYGFRKEHSQFMPLLRISVWPWSFSASVSIFGHSWLPCGRSWPPRWSFTRAYSS